MNEKIIKLYQNGKSMREIARLMHHSKNTNRKDIYNFLHTIYQDSRILDYLKITEK